MSAAARSVRPTRLVPVPPVDLRLLSAPLDFLEAEHYRQRIVLDNLDALADGVDAPAAAELAAGALRYMREDLPLHVADEERDLFPLLRRRAGPGDDIEFILALLASEHMRDHELSTAVVAVLERGQSGATRGAKRDAPSLKVAVPAFAETQRRHLAWENALIIPRARHLLKQADLVRLGRSMAKRRGLRVPGTRFTERLARLINLDTA
jgi:iron-sulfur cluster repair protein YtfE (RIC family)